MIVLVVIAFIFAIVAIGLWSHKHNVAATNLPLQKNAIGSLSLLSNVPLINVVITARSVSRQIFLIGFLARIGAYVILLLTGAISAGISFDSLKYHHQGIVLAQQYSRNEIIWKNWIDDGWFEFVGLVYSIFGAEMFWIQLLNIFLGAATGVLTYLIAKKVYQNEPVARFAGYATALFPSFIYYSAIPLKDTASLMAILLMVWSAVNLRERFRARYVFYMFSSLLIVLSLREYLFFVCLALLILSLGPVSSRRSVRYMTLMLGGGMFLGCVSYTLSFGFFGLDFFESSQYFDIDFINETRAKLNRGRGQMFVDPTGIEWGAGLLNDIKNLFMGLYYFFFSIDPMEITRTRQLFAVPEMIVLLLAFTAIIRGIFQTWRHKREIALPIILFAFGIMAVYSSATTNMGAMFRWRMQALPFFMMMASFGIFLRQRGVLFRLMKYFSRR